MKETKVAVRYAKSLLDLAREKGIADAIMSDMQLLDKVCEMNRELILLLSNPIIHGDKKTGILTKVFEGKMNPLSLEFFKILTHKGREGYLHQIALQYISQYKKIKGIETAVITTAVGLDDKLRSAVYKLIQESTNSEVELVEKIDKRIIGGMIIRMEDNQYDASIATELKKLTREFASNPYVRKN